MPRSIEPTKIERENGWDEYRLAEYIASRDQAAGLRIFGELNSKDVRVENVRRFNPHRWQRGG